jgi:hypothetical protein
VQFCAKYPKLGLYRPHEIKSQDQNNTQDKQATKLYFST